MNWPASTCARGKASGCARATDALFVTGALAALGCGAVVMPIHHQMKSAELSEMLSRAPLCAILDDGCGTGLAGKTGRGVELARGSGLRFTRLDGPQLPLAPGIDDAAFVRFTSGTTGAAKGVTLTHRGCSNACAPPTRDWA